MTKTLFVCYKHGCGGEGLTYKISQHNFFKTLKADIVNNRTIIKNDYFDKQMHFTRTVIYLNEPTTYKGTWEFWNKKKQIKINYKMRSRDTSEIYTILCLEKDTFWICNNEKEIHYMTYIYQDKY